MGCKVLKKWDYLVEFYVAINQYDNNTSPTTKPSLATKKKTEKKSKAEKAFNGKMCVMEVNSSKRV